VPGRAKGPRADGRRAEFEIGLEVDSVEVRGMLLYQGQPWGSVVFDYRT
jgi:hypothetical protein